MNQDLLLMVMAGAVVVSAVALLIQMFMLIGMYKAVNGLKEQITAFIPKAEGVLATTEKTVAEHSAQLKELTAKAQDLTSKGMEIVSAAQVQLGKVDVMVTEASSKAKAQLERVEMVLDDTVSRVHHTVIQLNNGVLKPVKEINGIAAGVRAAFDQLTRSRRPSVAQATSDEEMFI